MNMNYIKIICLQTTCASFASDVRQPHAARKAPWFTLGNCEQGAEENIGPTQNTSREAAGRYTME